MQQVENTAGATGGRRRSRVTQIFMFINIFKRFKKLTGNGSKMRGSPQMDDDSSNDEDEKEFTSAAFKNKLRKGYYGKTYGEEEFLEAFSYFDTNCDGKITATELGRVLKKLNINMKKQDVKKMIQELDKDGSGSIDYIEFSHMMTMPATVESEEYELREAFKSIDLDGNGTLSKDELKEMVQRTMQSDISEQEIEEMMNEADTDGDNEINFDEFVKILVEKRF